MNAAAALKVAAIIAVPSFALALSPQPPTQQQPPATAQPPTATQPVKVRPQGEPRSEWREKYREELREHPRIARSLIELHQTKEYLEKAPHDFGGHRVAAIRAIDESIKQLKEAMKFDEKHDGEPHRHAPAPAPTTGGK